MLDDDESFVRAKTVTLLGHVYVSECLWKIFCEENRYSKVKLKFGQLTSVKFGQRDVADILNVFFQIYEKSFTLHPKIWIAVGNFIRVSEAAPGGIP